MEINVKRLIRDLTNPDDDLRTLSAMTLMKIDLPERAARDTVIQSLMKATRDKNVSVRFFARRAIDKLRRSNLEEDGHANRPSLDDGLAAEDYTVRLEAVMQIARENRSEFKDRLMTMLSTEHHDFVKASLISALRKFLTKEEAGLLSPFLRDPDNRVRSNTIEALEFLKAEDSIPSLFSALEDPDNRIRAVAAKALQSFGEEKVFAVLRKMLHSDEEWMKGSAIYALSHIQAGEAITLLIETAKGASQTETRLRALIALANYQDLTSYGFLKFTATTTTEPFKEAAQRALKLFEEKFGNAPPTTSMVAQPEEKTEPTKPAGGAKKSAPEAQTDLSGTVTRFFRKGKEEAVGLSQRAAINFALTDLEKEQTELLKEAGRVVFEMYQQGELHVPELLTIGHEILRMNFFIQKYSEETPAGGGQEKGGFLAQLRGLFSKAAPPSPKSQQAERFTKQREDLFLRLGKAAFHKFKNEEFSTPALEGYFQAYQNLDKKIGLERSRMT
jgi:HEAT repeat protein